MIACIFTALWWLVGTVARGNFDRFLLTGCTKRIVSFGMIPYENFHWNSTEQPKTIQFTPIYGTWRVCFPSDSASLRMPRGDAHMAKVTNEPLQYCWSKNSLFGETAERGTIVNHRSPGNLRTVRLISSWLSKNGRNSRQTGFDLGSIVMKRVYNNNNVWEMGSISSKNEGKGHPFVWPGHVLRQAGNWKSCVVDWGRNVWLLSSWAVDRRWLVSWRNFHDLLRLWVDEACEGIVYD